MSSDELPHPITHGDWFKNHKTVLMFNLSAVSIIGVFFVLLLEFDMHRLAEAFFHPLLGILVWLKGLSWISFYVIIESLIEQIFCGLYQMQFGTVRFYTVIAILYSILMMALSGLVLTIVISTIGFLI